MVGVIGGIIATTITSGGWSALKAGWQLNIRSRREGDIDQLEAIFRMAKDELFRASHLERQKLIISRSQTTLYLGFLGAIAMLIMAGTSSLESLAAPAFSVFGLSLRSIDAFTVGLTWMAFMVVYGSFAKAAQEADREMLLRRMARCEDFIAEMFASHSEHPRVQTVLDAQNHRSRGARKP